MIPGSSPCQGDVLPLDHGTLPHTHLPVLEASHGWRSSSTGGLVAEYNPATVETRVRFPVGAALFFPHPCLVLPLPPCLLLACVRRGGEREGERERGREGERERESKHKAPQPRALRVTQYKVEGGRGRALFDSSILLMSQINRARGDNTVYSGFVAWATHPGGVAQVVERVLSMDEAAGSMPATSIGLAILSFSKQL